MPWRRSSEMKAGTSSGTGKGRLRALAGSGVPVAFVTLHPLSCRGTGRRRMLVTRRSLASIRLARRNLLPTCGRGRPSHGPTLLQLRASWSLRWAAVARAAPLRHPPAAESSPASATLHGPPAGHAERRGSACRDAAHGREPGEVAALCRQPYRSAGQHGRPPALPLRQRAGRRGAATWQHRGARGSRAWRGRCARKRLHRRVRAHRRVVTGPFLAAGAAARLPAGAGTGRQSRPGNHRRP